MTKRQRFTPEQQRFTHEPEQHHIVQLHMSVNVDTAEFANLQPDQVLALVVGIGHVVAALAELDRRLAEGQED